MSLADALERSAVALSDVADDIRPANGDPIQLLSLLDGAAQVRVLTWLLSNESEFGGELAVAWADEPRGTEALLELDAAGLPKSGRKGLRRALHRLRSRGVEVDKDAGREPVVARLPTIADDFEMAFVSSLDPRGTRLAYLVEPNPSGGARLFEVLIDDLRGVVDFELYVAGRSKVREFVKRLRSGRGLSVVKASPPAVRAAIARAHARQPSDRLAPKGFGEWRAHFAADPDQLTPGAEFARSMTDDPPPAALSRAAELVRSGELGPWPPGSARLQSLGELVRESTESKIVVSGARSADRLDQAVAAAAADLFEGDYAEATAIRFEESAYVLSQSGKAEDAAACVAAARSFRDGAAGESAIAKALIEECLGSFLASLRDKDKEGDDDADDESLIVTP